MPPIGTSPCRQALTWSRPTKTTGTRRWSLETFGTKLHLIDKCCRIAKEKPMSEHPHETHRAFPKVPPRRKFLSRDRHQRMRTNSPRPQFENAVVFFGGGNGGWWDLRKTPRSLTVRPWKMVAKEDRSFSIGGSVTFQGQTVKLRGWVSLVEMASFFEAAKIGRNFQAQTAPPSCAKPLSWQTNGLGAQISQGFERLFHDLWLSSHVWDCLFDIKTVSPWLSVFVTHLF